MEYRVTSAAFCFDEVGAYKRYQEAFEAVNAKIMTDYESGNVSIIVDFQTIDQLANFANSIKRDLVFPAARPGHNKELTIWIKDDYME